jgi:addiction module HigA family antidote
MVARRDELKAPPHPGEYLREDILPALNMTIGALAKHLGVTRTTLSQLINEKRDVSLEMAQRLGQAFGNGARFWLALQMQHDLWKAERDTKIRVDRIRWRESEAA